MKQQQPKHGLSRHCHHDVKFEYCFDFDERVEYIKSDKPEEEQPIRLKAFALFKGKLPAPQNPQSRGKSWRRI